MALAFTALFQAGRTSREEGQKPSASLAGPLPWEALLNNCLPLASQNAVTGPPLAIREAREGSFFRTQGSESNTGHNLNCVPARGGLCEPWTAGQKTQVACTLQRGSTSSERTLRRDSVRHHVMPPHTPFQKQHTAFSRCLYVCIYPEKGLGVYTPGRYQGLGRRGLDEGGGYQGSVGFIADTQSSVSVAFLFPVLPRVT